MRGDCKYIEHVPKAIMATPPTEDDQDWVSVRTGAALRRTSIPRKDCACLRKCFSVLMAERWSIRNKMSILYVWTYCQTLLVSGQLLLRKQPLRFQVATRSVLAWECDVVLRVGEVGVGEEEDDEPSDSIEAFT